MDGELRMLLSLFGHPEKNRGDDAKNAGLLTCVLYLHDPFCIANDGERVLMDVYLGKIIDRYITANGNSDIEYWQNICIDFA